MAYRILLIDDEPDLGPLVRINLKRYDMVVEQSFNGREGLVAAQANPPDLILLDVYMPLETGIETLEKLKADPVLGKIPVVMLTGVEQADIITAVYDRGAEWHLTKPVEFDLLVEVMQRLLEPRPDASV